MAAHPIKPLSPESQAKPATIELHSTHTALQALWVLSGFSEDVDGEELATIISEAPDPETACRVITNRVKVSSDALQKKWRKIIREAWMYHHPQASSHFNLPLTSSDVCEVEILHDTYAFLASLVEKPATITVENKEQVIEHQDVQRLLKVMPSMQGDFPEKVESEWSCPPLRRLRAVLQELRLVRLHKGELVVVKSRYEKFLNLPMPQQYYALWHTDVYHINWEDYSSRWGRYASLIQHYMPLVWQVGEGVCENAEDSVQDVVEALLDMFQPLWYQEGLQKKKTEERTLYEMYEQAALPSVVEKLIVTDVLVRYGLIQRYTAGLPWVGVSRELADEFTWTRIGTILIQAEREKDLPCGLDILE